MKTLRAIFRTTGAARLAAALAWMFVILAGCTLLPGNAQAANQITGGCSSSSTTLTIPDYDTLLKTQVTTTGTIAVQCTGTGTVSVTVAITLTNGSCASRAMKNGGNSLTYGIYTTSGYGTAWCEPTRQSVSFTFNSQTVPQTLNQNVTYYVRVPASQSPSIATYSESVSTLVYWSGGNSSASAFTIQQPAVAGCTLSTTAMTFAAYTGTAIYATGYVNATCTASAGYTVALGQGSNYSTTRRMAYGGNYIGYRLYSDAGRTTLWGNGVTLGNTVAGTGNGSQQQIPVYGATIAGTVPPPATYSDSVVVTLTY